VSYVLVKKNTFRIRFCSV